MILTVPVKGLKPFNDVLLLSQRRFCVKTKLYSFYSLNRRYKTENQSKRYFIEISLNEGLTVALKKCTEIGC